MTSFKSSVRDLKTEGGVRQKEGGGEGKGLNIRGVSVIEFRSVCV